MAVVDTLKIYEVLRPTLDEEPARAITEVIERSLEEYRKNQREFLTTKEDITNLRVEMEEDIANLKAEVKEDIANLRAEVKEDIANLRAEVKEDIISLRTEVKEDIANLRIEMHRIRADLIRWMFIFWAGQIGVVTCILFAFFK